jgi:hypothetical protein
MGCDIVGVEREGEVRAYWRYVFLDFHGNVVYDKFVPSERPVKSWKAVLSARDIPEGQMVSLAEVGRWDGVRSDV